MVNEQTGEELGHEHASWFKSVADLFDWIDALEKRKVDVLTIEYDETYSYPSRVSVDPLEDAMDDEMAYYTSELIPTEIASLAKQAVHTTLQFSPPSTLRKWRAGIPPSIYVPIPTRRENYDGQVFHLSISPLHR